MLDFLLSIIVRVVAIFGWPAFAIWYFAIGG